MGRIVIELVLIIGVIVTIGAGLINYTMSRGRKLDHRKVAHFSGGPLDGDSREVDEWAESYLYTYTATKSINEDGKQVPHRYQRVAIYELTDEDVYQFSTTLDAEDYAKLKN